MPDDSRLHPAGTASARRSIESRDSWVAAGVTLAILSISYGAPLIIVVGLKTMQTDLGTDRSVLALAGAFVWVGTGLGGIVMGRLADRIGMRTTALIGGSMMAAGLALSATGRIWAIFVGHGVLIGLLGNGALYPPLITYVSRWFDRRRGTAIALISSGQYIAGVIWPFVFERGMARFGWQAVMLGYAAVVLATILPTAFLFLRPPPEMAFAAPGLRGVRRRARVLGLHPNVVQALICLASLFVLHPDGDPVGASGGVLRRYRHRRRARGGDAVRAAGLRLHQPAVLGRFRRPLRRPAHGDGRLGVPGGGDRRLPADAERGRAVRHRRGVRVGICRHHSGLRGCDPGPVSGVRSIVARTVDAVHRQ